MGVSGKKGGGGADLIQPIDCIQYYVLAMASKRIAARKVQRQKLATIATSSSAISRSMPAKLMVIKCY